MTSAHQPTITRHERAAQAEERYVSDLLDRANTAGRVALSDCSLTNGAVAWPKAQPTEAQSKLARHAKMQTYLPNWESTITPAREVSE